MNAYLEEDVLTLCKAMEHCDLSAMLTYCCITNFSTVCIHQLVMAVRFVKALKHQLVEEELALCECFKYI